jgi:hypothetical protein
MDDEVDRLNRLLDDLAAERNLRDHGTLTPDEVILVRTAAALKAAHSIHSEPTDAFLDRLAARLTAARPSY